MKPTRVLVCILLIVACLAGPITAAAAEVSVVAEYGVSDVLANEFRSIVARSLQFYQEVYTFVPTRAITIIIVPDEAAYLRVLQNQGLMREQAVRVAKASAAVSVGARPTIVVCADKNPTYLTRIRTVTHEIFHQMQWGLKSYDSDHNWLAEGSARMTEYVLLEWLGEGTLASHRQNLVNILANVKLKAAPDELTEGGAKWASLMEQKMYAYEVSELMTSYLVSLVGKPPTVKYFAYVRETGGREAAFKKAFGMTHGEFINKYKT
jgi:hypothetical protein